MTLCQCIFSLASQMSILVTALWLSGHSLFQLLLSMKTNYVFCKKCDGVAVRVGLFVCNFSQGWLNGIRSVAIYEIREIFKN